MRDFTAGAHCNTKIYIAPSNKAWIAPTNMIFLSFFIILSASLMPDDMIYRCMYYI
jgi:hypothetical protein